MASPGKYNFTDVLVADVRFPLAESISPPQVIQLNSKLNKCQKTAARAADSTASFDDCASCCLEADNSEFKRRTDDESGLLNHACFGKYSSNLMILTRYLIACRLTSAVRNRKMRSKALHRCSAERQLTSERKTCRIR